jgi:hypothetical protein
MHECHIAGYRFAEDQPEDGPEDQRATQVRAATKARQRRPVEAG